jgi:photosystem II stability/assembly factor-like uncharacterized protein
MKYTLIICLCIAFFSCKNEEVIKPRTISKVEIETIMEDSTLSVRALDFNDDYIYYGSADHFGKHALSTENKLDISKLKFSSNKHHFKYVVTHDSLPLHFRAIKEVNETLFAVSIANPGKLYKLKRKAKGPKLVYEEANENVFYDAMNFWNDKEGLAIGDPTDDCMSVIITRDGGYTWTKLPCNDLPKIKDGEAAFAASDSNIAIVGDNTWVATGGKASRILYSSDKGLTWHVFETPIVQGLETTGMYSVDFYDDLNGYAIGGDYTKPDRNTANKIRTADGGKTWAVVADGQNPGYRSCVQYIPNRGGKELVAIGFNGIDYSNDSGDTWIHLSDEGFYTIRFINDSEAYAAGKGRISKLVFE